MSDPITEEQRAEAANLERRISDAIREVLSGSHAPLTFDQSGIDRVRAAIEASIGRKVPNAQWVCKPHRWIGWDDSICPTCEKNGVRLMQPWPTEVAR